MAGVRVETASGSYDVLVGPGLLNDLAHHAAGQLRPYRETGRPVPIVADRNARDTHGQRVLASLSASGLTARFHDIEPGESSKDWASLQALLDWLLSQNISRSDTIFALGGGVVGDLTGFAAAILKRGCRFVQLPTTLLAQVDSSVGGKTAINTPAGKNLVGAFHQPDLVLADTDTLATLPPREVRAGYAEIVKYGVLGDAAFFGWLETNGAAVTALEPAAVENAVPTSVAAVGMVLAARYSARIGLCDADVGERLTAVLDRAGMVSEIAALPLACGGDRLVDHMRQDKKASGNSVPLILLRAMGDAFVRPDADLADVALFLDEQLQAH